MGLRSLTRRFTTRRETALDLFPVGFMMWAPLPDEADLPPGFIECDGSVVDSAVYPELHAALIAAASPFGTSGPDPLLPDAQGRAVVSLGPNAAVSTIGANEGEASPAARAAHAHNVPGHTHGVDSHQHEFGAHSHSSPAHTHIGEAHTHSLNSHGHDLSGSTGGAISGDILVTDAGGGNRVTASIHTHTAQTLGAQQVDPGVSGSGGDDVTFGVTDPQNGGDTEDNVAGQVDAASDTVSANTAADSETGSLPYYVSRFIIKAVA